MLKFLEFSVGESLLVHVHKVLLVVTRIPAFGWLIALIQLRLVNCE